MNNLISTSFSVPVETVETYDDLDRRIMDNAVEVTFATPEDERQYEEMDWRLHLEICRVLSIEPSPTRADRLVHVNEDWFPTMTKFVEADVRALGAHEVEELGALLAGPFADWRINVQLYEGYALEQSRHVGGINIYADRLLAQGQALQAIVPRGIAF